MKDDPAVKDVMKSQQWSLDVADVEPDWRADVVADEQDVLVAIDVDRMIGSCGKGKLCVCSVVVEVRGLRSSEVQLT